MTPPKAKVPAAPTAEPAVQTGVLSSAPVGFATDTVKGQAESVEFSTKELAHAAMVRARAALVLEHPFFGSLALRLKLREDATCRDLWTDGKVLGYNPVYASTLPEDKLIGAQAHELLHLACAHHLRRKGRDEQLWNKACDYAINGILLEAGFALPGGFLFSPEYATLPVDSIYSILSKMLEDETHGGASSMQDKEAASNPDASGAAKLDDGTELDGTSQQSSQAKDAAEEGAESATSKSSTGKIVEAAEDGRAEEDVAFHGEVRDTPGLQAGETSNAAQKKAEEDLDIALTQATGRALNMGSLPAGISRLVAERLRPTLDWRALLQRFLEDCAASDYSWSNPNRRYIFQDIYLPSRRDPQIPHIVLAVDASGSIDEAALEAFCAELSSILDVYDTTLTVLFHDTKVQSTHTFSRADLPLRLVPVGGGGTDYRPVGDYLLEQNLEPSCMLWFTDLECSLFPEAPSCPLLWVVTGNAAERPAHEFSLHGRPPFGECISLNSI